MSLSLAVTSYPACPSLCVSSPCCGCSSSATTSSPRCRPPYIASLTCGSWYVPPYARLTGATPQLAQWSIFRPHRPSPPPKLTEVTSALSPWYKQTWIHNTVMMTHSAFLIIIIHFSFPFSLPHISLTFFSQFVLTRHFVGPSFFLSYSSSSSSSPSPFSFCRM